MITRRFYGVKNLEKRQIRLKKLHLQRGGGTEIYNSICIITLYFGVGRSSAPWFTPRVAGIVRY
jgi:hypothetical protein